MTRSRTPLMGGLNLRKYPFDVLVNKVPRHPEYGKLIMTYYGALVSLADGELGFEPDTVIRRRFADGKGMNIMEFAEEGMFTVDWDFHNLASFLEYATVHRQEFEALIQTAPAGFCPKVKRLALMFPGSKSTATGVEAKLRTPHDFGVFWVELSEVRRFLEQRLGLQASITTRQSKGPWITADLPQTFNPAKDQFVLDQRFPQEFLRFCLQICISKAGCISEGRITMKSREWEQAIRAYEAPVPFDPFDL